MGHDDSDRCVKFTFPRTVVPSIYKVVWHAPGGPVTVGELSRDFGGWAIHFTRDAELMDEPTRTEMVKQAQRQLDLYAVTDRLMGRK